MQADLVPWLQRMARRRECVSACVRAWGEAGTSAQARTGISTITTRIMKTPSSDASSTHSTSIISSLANSPSVDCRQWGWRGTLSRAPRPAGPVPTQQWQCTHAFRHWTQRHRSLRTTSYESICAQSRASARVMMCAFESHVSSSPRTQTLLCTRECKTIQPSGWNRSHP